MRPDDAVTVLSLGDVYLTQGRPEAAEPVFMKQLRLQPDSVVANVGLGRTALARSDHARAVKHLEEGLRLSQQSAVGIHCPLALAYRGLGNSEKTEAHMRQRADVDILPADPLMEELAELLESPQASEERGNLALTRGEWAAAAEYFRQGLAMVPADPTLRHRLGTALCHLLSGWNGLRDWNWDLSAEIQQELGEGLSMTVGFYQNTGGYYEQRNSKSRVTDNLAVTPEDYDPYCVTAPVDPRLPDGGGYEVCGLYNVSPEKFGQQELFRTRREPFGRDQRLNQFFGVTCDWRLPNGARLGGGFDTGRSIDDRCFVVDSSQDLLNCRSRRRSVPRRSSRRTGLSRCRVTSTSAPPTRTSRGRTSWGTSRSATTTSRGRWAVTCRAAPGRRPSRSLPRRRCSWIGSTASTFG